MIDALLYELSKKASSLSGMMGAGTAKLSMVTACG
jgi:hypothetical protein